MTTRISHEGTHIYFVPAVNSLAAPTVAELGAGVDLSDYVTRDGLATPTTQNTVDTAGINSAHDSQAVGTYGGPVVLTLFRDAQDETDTFEGIEYRDAGFIVVSRFGPAVATSRVEVYPAEAGQPQPMPSAQNDAQKYQQTFAVTSEPELHAVVASS